jgi:radical SAM protein with 4Fe4S-binding SPASM domain
MTQCRWYRTAQVMNPKSYPNVLQVEITNRCNLKCSMCRLRTSDSPSNFDNGHMDEKVWKKVAEIAENVNHVGICGYGEPLCNPKFIDHLKDIDRMGVATSFSTNGTALTESIAEALSGLKHLDSINVSVDSPDPDIYHKIRGGDLNRTIRGLKFLIDNIDRPEKITISSVVMRSNLLSLTELPKFLSNMGLKKLILQKFVEWNPDNNEEGLINKANLKKIIENIEFTCKNLNIGLEVVPALKNDLIEPSTQEDIEVSNSKCVTKQCYLPWEIPFINREGLVFPCCFTSHEYMMGDLKENSFDEIWTGDRFQTFRKNLLDGVSMPSICRNCKVALDGPNKFSQYSAELILGRSTLFGDLLSAMSSVIHKEIRLKLFVKNTGENIWKKNTPLHIGTSNKRERDSAYWHPNWLSPQRICSFTEDEIPPGEIATFDMAIAPALSANSEVFQLVLDEIDSYHYWLPDTQFEMKAIEFYDQKHFPNNLKKKILDKILVYFYSAQIQEDQSSIKGGPRLRLVVKNSGHITWTKNSKIRIGTLWDRDSSYYHKSWINPNRVCSFAEDKVPPGEMATFDFMITQEEAMVPETFQVVAEGVAWLPGTQFEVRF